MAASTIQVSKEIGDSLKLIKTASLSTSAVVFLCDAACECIQSGAGGEIDFEGKQFFTETCLSLLRLPAHATASSSLHVVLHQIDN